MGHRTRSHIPRHRNPNLRIRTHHIVTINRRRAWLNRLRDQRGLQPLANDPKNHSAHRDLLLDRLADAFEQHVNLAPLLQP